MTYKNRELWQCIIKEDLIEKYYNDQINVNNTKNGISDHEFLIIRILNTK